MTTLQKFHLISHYKGTGTTASPVTLTSPTYSTSYTPLSVSNPVSYVQWKPATQSAAADKRVIRSRYDQFVAFLISIRPTTSTWQTRLTRVDAGVTRWLRPSHVHCVPDAPVAPGTTSLNDIYGGFGTVQHTYPGGTVIDKPVFEAIRISDGSVFARRIGTTDGKLFDYTTINGSTLRYRVTDPTGVWGQSFSNPFDSTNILTAFPYFLNHQQTSNMSPNIWPQNTFTAWGAAYLQGGKDWMPPVLVNASATVDFDCDMSLWRIDQYTAASIAAGDSIGPTNNATPKVFAYSRHASLPAGLYWRNQSYPGTYATGSARWEAVPGSDVTGYSAPTEEPSCPFVIKQGTI